MEASGGGLDPEPIRSASKSGVVVVVGVCTHMGCVRTRRARAGRAIAMQPV